MKTHHCHAIGCETPTPPRLLMCPAHWRQVPAELQAAVRRAFNPRQCVLGPERVPPSSAWIAASARARAHVARLEGRELAVKFLEDIARAADLRAGRAALRGTP